MSTEAKADPVRAQAWAKLEREWAIGGMPADKIRLARAAFDAGAALAQQAGAEPVAWQIIQKNGISVGGIYRDKDEARLCGLFDDEIDTLRPLYLAPQPAIAEGAFQVPRNRSEAASLAKQALAYLGVIDAHIDAAIARCETDAQHNQESAR